MIQPGRKYSATNSYRYGFNGKENDNETSGQGNQLDYGFRIYNPRLGRFLSVDPLSRSYPWNSPYAFAEGDVIRSVDLDGLEHKVVIHWIDKVYADGSLHISKTSVTINQCEQFDTWGEPYKQQDGGFVHALTETYYYMMGEKTLYKGKDFIEVVADNSLNVPPPSAKYDYTKNVIPGKFSEDWDWAGLSFNKHRILMERDFQAPDNASTVEDVTMGMIAFTTVLGITPMAKAMMKAEGIAVSGVNVSKVKTITDKGETEALQSSSLAAVSKVDEVANGATLYRYGTRGISKTGERAQFWALENPMVDPEGYAKKYGIPVDNIKNADFIEIANVKPGGKFITREAPPATGGAKGTGGGIEVVTEVGGTANNKIITIKR